MFDWELLLWTIGAALALCVVVMGPPTAAFVISERGNKRLAQRYREEREQAHRDYELRAALFHAASETAVNLPVANSQVTTHNPGRRRLLPLHE